MLESITTEEKTLLSGKKVLMVMAHPDDEVIFGWPIIQLSGVDVHVLCCSNDKNNPSRVEFSKRKDALERLMAKLGFSFSCFNYDSEFYRMSTRDELLSNVLSMLMNQISSIKHDFVFSHNPLGEYGHIDHVLINQLVMSSCSRMLMTDMFIKSNWVPYGGFSEIQRRCFFKNENVVSGCKIDQAHYDMCKQVYVDHGCWTWSKPPITETKLYLV